MKKEQNSYSHRYLTLLLILSDLKLYIYELHIIELYIGDKAYNEFTVHRIFKTSFSKNLS